MPEPLSTGVSLAKTFGLPVARQLIKWQKGSEARQLVDALKSDHPAAPKMLIQPDLLEELWAYAETGELDEEGLLRGLKAIPRARKRRTHWLRLSARPNGVSFAMIAERTSTCCGSRLRSGSGDPLCAAVLPFEARRDEYLSALAQAQAREEPVQVVELAQTLTPFLQRRSYWHDGERVLEWGLQAARQLEDRALEAHMLDELGTVHRLQARWLAAEEEFRQALETFIGLDDVVGQARTLSNLGLVLRKRGQLSDAADSFERSIDLWQAAEGRVEEDDRRFGLARSLNNLGMVLRDSGDQRALEYFHGALAIREEIGDAEGMSRTLNNLGQLNRRQGDVGAAIESHRRALEIRQGLGDLHGVARTEGQLAEAYLDAGELTAAESLLADALTIRTRLGDRYGEAHNAAVEAWEGALDLFRSLGADDDVRNVQRRLG